MNINSSSPYLYALTSASVLREPPVGEANIENSGSVLKPVQEASSISSTKPQAENLTGPANSGLASNNPDQLAESTKAGVNTTQPGDGDQKQQQEQARQLQVEQEEIQQLAARDREVRNHERAHAAVGGQYAGSPRYQFQRGPDGVNYAVGGEVSISTGAINGDPEATIKKAQVIRRAALAPAEPSPQDRSVAAQAAQMESQARVELSNLQREERLEEQNAQAENKSEDESRKPLEASAVDSDAESHSDQQGVQLAQVQSPQQADPQAIFNRLSNDLNNRLISGSGSSQAFRLGQTVSRFA